MAQPALPAPPDAAAEDDVVEYADHSTYFHRLCKILCGSCPECNRRSLECEPVEYGRTIRAELTGHDYRCSREHCPFSRRVNDETIVQAAGWAIDSQAWQYYPPNPPQRRP